MTAPDLSGYRAVHLALRGGADAMASVAATIQPGNRPRVSALVRYWAGYSAELHQHHTTEDDLIFPALIARVPVAAELIERTDAEHGQLDALVARCNHALAALADGVRSADLAASFAGLAAHMATHLDFEDDDVLPLFERHFTVEEYTELEQQAMADLDMRQALFAVPFILHWATPALRADVLGSAPLPLRAVYRLTRRRHARLVASLFGTEPTLTAAPAAEAVA